MAPSEKQPFYDPVPPTYDEALAGSSRQDYDWPPSRSSVDHHETESQSLLRRPETAPGSSRRPNGYRQPTVESDDSDIASLLESDTDDEEAAQVRREVEELDIEEPSNSRGLSWGKRIGFSLPKWKWSWRPRLPRLPRIRIQLPQRPEPADDAGASGETETEETQTATATRRWQIPKIDRMVAFVMFARVLAITIILGFIYLLFATDVFTFNGRLGGGFRFNAEDLRVHILNNVDPRRLRASVKHFSSYAHIAGTEGDYATAMDVDSMFARAGLDEVLVDEYSVYLNYPRKDGRSVEIMDGDKSVWAATLEEEEIGEETAGHQTYAFHGHSKSGDVRGPLIYANYGSRDDFKNLKDRKIDTKGAIALVRYGGTQGDRALKVKAAEEAGFAGCLIYSDPEDDGFAKGEVAPNGRFMPADGVQRGSVSLMSWVIGDVLTPGWESKEGQPRMKVDESPGLNKIPSLPLAWRDAQVLLQFLKGHGEKVPDEWKGSVPDVKEWWTGDHKSPIVRVRNEQDENERQPIWNVYGKILGMEQSAKSIIIGNHRDAWAFGATDPHSGTAVMIEMARIFGDLILRGWRPLRSIEFMSWDAEEYNLIGSTEYVENNVKSLRENAYAYINLDTVVAGNEFHAAGSPLLRKSLLHALGRIQDPKLNQTLRELWEDSGQDLEGLGAGSDYVAFQDIAGTSSIDLEFRGDFPYHSSYDNFDLVESVIDPDFTYHGLMAQVVGLMILDLADKSIMPFDLPAYGDKLKTWVDDLEKWAKSQTKDHDVSLDFKVLKDAALQVKNNADTFAQWEQKWDHLVMQSGGWEGNDVGQARLDYNEKMAAFETALLDLERGGGVSLHDSHVAER
jgi:N-acetylated-alpha-linked acidic dipeptidase